MVNAKHFRMVTILNSCVLKAENIVHGTMLLHGRTEMVEKSYQIKIDDVDAKSVLTI